ncbi:HNH endonuclease signature motif containing protein [Streptomyces sp. ME03-5709C]|nr:HNH endonuclease signature motif containing protein [Streptomyces sp. ME03-5709C]
MDHVHLSARIRALINERPAAPRVRPAAERLLDKVTPGWGGCWIYTGHIHKNTGYGTFTVSAKRTTTAHRISYELFVGPVTKGVHVDHRCHNQATDCPGGRTCIHRRCINPLHLEAVTGRENLLRSSLTVAGANARKTHCPNGHEYTPENTYRIPGRPTNRYCRECSRQYKRNARKAGGVR